MYSLGPLGLRFHSPDAVTLYAVLEYRRARAADRAGPMGLDPIDNPKRLAANLRHIADEIDRHLGL